MTADLLVAGAGMAGLAAAARAAEHGLRVVVAEKRPEIGGAAALSAGILWTAPDMETLERVVPDAEPEIARALVEGFDPAIEALRAAGVAVSERWTGQMGFGVAHHVDIRALLARWSEQVEVRTSTPVQELLDDHDGPVLLATGGFQGDGALLRELVGTDALLLRGLPESCGDGLRIARAAGAADSPRMDTFYGHLVPHPLRRFMPKDFLPLTQYHSRDAVLVNRAGQRFCDETRGDEVSNQAVLRQPGRRAVLLCDEAVRRQAVAAPYPHGAVVDRFAAAADAGARMASEETQDALADRVAEWGIDGAELRRTLAAADRVREPPFHALEVQPAITFTLGGVRVDADGHALDRSGAPVPGLWVAGADAGGLQGPGYVAGLALGLVLGRRAADSIAHALATTGGGR